MKKCTKCGAKKSLDSFRKDSSKKDGKYSSCKSCVKKYSKKYLIENKEDINKRRKNNYIKNKEKILFRNKVWRDNNKSKVSNYNKKKKKRYMRDPVFRVKHRMISYLRLGLTKKLDSVTGSMINILGCTYEELLLHLNDNPYGLIYGQEGVDIDHTIPLSLATTEKDVKKLFHYSNLQLLPSYYNRYVKINNKFNKKDLEEWIKNKKTQTK